MTAATPPDRWCWLYVDSPDQAAVVTAAGDLLGLASDLDVFTVPGFVVEVSRNPDRTRGPHFLDWPTVVDISSGDDVPDQGVVEFVTRLVLHLRAAGWRVGAECAFADRLPPPDTR